eukprot:7810357-Alexandrium_andersonii.AAC.1
MACADIQAPCRLPFSPPCAPEDLRRRPSGVDARCQGLEGTSRSWGRGAPLPQGPRGPRCA